MRHIRRRWLILAVAAVSAVAVVAIGLRGPGDESPEEAIYGLAHDVEHRDLEGVCARLFPTTYLDPRIARELRLPS